MNISYDSYRIFYYAAKYRSFSQAAASFFACDRQGIRRMHLVT